MVTSVQTAIHFDESNLAAGDGVGLFTRSVSFDGRLKANVILVHGLGEHSGRYLHVAEFFARAGYRLCMFDQRGHGKSEGDRGWVETYDQFLGDLATVAAHFRGESVPTFFYGHSFGGQILLNYLAASPDPIAGAIVASPWLKLVINPGTFKVLLARLTLRIWPRFTQEHNADPSRLSRDHAFLRAMPDLDLVHRRVSARLFSEMNLGAERANATAGQMRSPLLLIHGQNDPITSATATRDYFDRARASDKTLRIYAELLHETHNEIERDQVLAEICTWMEARLGPPPG